MESQPLCPSVSASLTERRVLRVCPRHKCRCLAPFLWAHNIPLRGICSPWIDMCVISWFSQYFQAQTLCFPAAMLRLLGYCNPPRGGPPTQICVLRLWPLLSLPDSQMTPQPSRQGGAVGYARPFACQHLPQPGPIPSAHFRTGDRRQKSSCQMQAWPAGSRTGVSHRSRSPL